MGSRDQNNGRNWRCFERHVLAYFGLPLILHTDNGQEFVNQYMSKLIINWDGDCGYKRGKPRAPHVQGLVEQDNGTLEKMINEISKIIFVKIF